MEELREKIILAPGANGSELLRSLARFEKNTLGVRIVGPVELARMALVRSGISTAERFLPAREEPPVVFSFIRDIPYFESASYKDAEDLVAALTTARKLIPENESAELPERLGKGEFPDKNDALIDAYGRYMAALKKEGLADGISLIRRAIAEAEPIDADFFVLEEFPLTPLDKALLDKVSGGKGKYEEKNLPGLYEKERKPIHVDEFTRAYGAINEAEDILRRIYRKSKSLDQYVVAVTDADAYGQVFYDLSKRYGIPVTFGAGINISNSNPAELARLLLAWNTTGYNGIDALRRILTSAAFDLCKLKQELGMGPKPKDLEQVVKMAGNLRLSFDRETNDKRLAAMKGTDCEDEQKTLKWVEKLAKVLETGYEGILKEYCVKRGDMEEKIDQSALSVITEGIRSLKDKDVTPEEILPELLNKTVSSENGREGALHVCTIRGALSAMRDNLFVCGLCSDSFPGKPSEDHLLLDRDLEQLDIKEGITSAKRVLANRDSLTKLLEAASALGVHVYLSYPDFDLAGIKEQNPSSCLLDLYEEAYPGEEQEAHFATAEYFSSSLSPTDAVGAKIAGGAEIPASPDVQTLPEAKDLLDGDWSPTALELFFQCPRHFYLRYIAGIREEEEDDPFTVISAADEGTLVHKLMEQTANKTMAESEFLDLSTKAFDDFLVRRPPMHPEEADKKKRQFLDMMKNAFKTNTKNKVVSAEEDYRHRYPDDDGGFMWIKGKPDRVEETAERDEAGNVTYLVADYKTKRRTDHKPNDINTCLQVVLYSWLCKQAGMNVTQAEYRYLRLGKAVPCFIDKWMLGELDKKLVEFKEAMETNEFPRNKGNDKENCRYCKFKDICDWDGEEVSEDDD